MDVNVNNMLTVPQVLPMAGMKASDAARLYAKSSGVNLDDPYGAGDITDQVMKNLKAQGFEADPALVKSMAEHILKARTLDGGLVTKATDPVILPQPYVSPTDFAAQYPRLGVQLSN